MSLPEPLTAEAVAQLPGAGAGPSPRVLAPTPAPPPRTRAVTFLRRAAKAVARRGLQVAAPGLLAQVTEGRAQVERLEQQVRDLQRSVGQEAVGGRVAEANRINLELLKGEVRALEATLRDLGMAFAPATGLEGAGVRFAEMREQVNAVERRVRLLDSRLASADAASPAPPAPATPTGPDEAADRGAPAPSSTLFNYVAFERRFRGDPQAVLETQAQRYGDLLGRHGPVLDVGCGRGELLEVLRRAGVEATGVDTDPGMVAEAVDRGLDVHLADVNSHLRSLAPGSLGAVFSAHLAEHLELDVLLEFIDLSLSRLRPGGVFVAETPNPASLIVLGNSYILDPTHVRPLHPSLFSFLCESAGFRDVRLEFYAPADGYHLQLTGHPDDPEWARRLDANFTRLNEVLFGPQEYAVVAHTPST